MLAAVGQRGREQPDAGAHARRLGIEVEVPLAIAERKLIASRCSPLRHRIDRQVARGGVRKLGILGVGS